MNSLALPSRTSRQEPWPDVCRKFGFDKNARKLNYPDSNLCHTYPGVNSLLPSKVILIRRFITKGVNPAGPLPYEWCRRRNLGSLEERPHARESGRPWAILDIPHGF